MMLHGWSVSLRFIQGSTLLYMGEMSPCQMRSNQIFKTYGVEAFG
jgi:hypothetical protein